MAKREKFIPAINKKPEKRSQHVYDSLCQCGHSMIAHHNRGKGRCLEANCCQSFVPQKD